jgi:hypothetical protein
MEVYNIIKRYNTLKGVRDGHWLPTWREARKFVMPNDVDYLSEGGKRGTELFDTTAVIACQRLASGIYAWMLDPAKRMIEVIANDAQMQQRPEVKDFYAKLSKKLLEKIANSNYSTVVQQMLQNCACGIDGVVYLEGTPDNNIRFVSVPIEQICYTHDAYGVVNTVFREMQMSAIQIVQKFPGGNIADKIKQEAENPEKMDTKHKILQVVLPRKNYKKDMLDNKNMPFADYYIDLEHKSIIQESGFAEFPYFVCRFEVSPFEDYGRGPGVNLLPDIKMINRIQQSYIIGLERSNDPDTLIPENSIIDETWNREAGATHIYKVGTNGEKPEYMVYPTNLNNIWNDIKERQQAIRQGFYLDIFDPLGDIKNITATEAEIRNEGKLVPFSTLVGNIHAYFLAPMIHRLIGIMARNFELLDMPEEVANNSQYKIEFVSKIALAIKQSEASNYLRFEAAMQGIFMRHPETEDNFDTDLIARDIAIATGANPQWLRKEKDRDMIREERNQAMQNQAQSDMIANEVKALGAMGGVEEVEKLEDMI